jgi:hypothetical protein
MQRGFPSDFPPPDAGPRWSGRYGQGCRVTAEAVGRSFVHVTTDDRGQAGMDREPRGDGLSFRGDPREVVADPEARYYGALLEERTLLPSADALTLDPRFEDWLVQTAPQRY